MLPNKPVCSQEMILKMNKAPAQSHIWSDKPILTKKTYCIFSNVNMKCQNKTCNLPHFKINKTSQLLKLYIQNS